MKYSSNSLLLQSTNRSNNQRDGPGGSFTRIMCFTRTRLETPRSGPTQSVLPSLPINHPMSILSLPLFYIKRPNARWPLQFIRLARHSLPRYFIPCPRFSSVAIRRCARDNGRSAAPSPSTTPTWSPPAGAGRSPRTPLFS
jgi:hypothetical protein